ncbi:MAG: hypothetical protein IPP35_00505 [Elusimicrobia bacterium]|nr:hypothetical protein [Elusimicrobiota bacterium]
MKSAIALVLLLLAAGLARAEVSALNLGLDYRLRAIGIQNNDTQPDTRDNLSYYSHQARLYMTGWLNEDVEAGIRVQSVSIWGLEGSTSAPVSRYPKTDGTPWIEQVYLHMPNLMNKHLDITIGRQPIVIGDGMLVSDDQLGFNALRAKIALPRRASLDLFTAKITESLEGHNDSDLNGVVGALDQGDLRWELAWIQENNSGPSPYTLAGATTTAAHVVRNFYDLRLFGNLKDAYYKMEVAMEKGDANVGPGGVNTTIAGLGERLELGAQSDTAKFGRFGVKALYASGSGDDPGTADKDEAFRASFAGRWDGLQRAGWGQHFGATLSDAYSPSSPFSPTDTGLPPGASGIKTMGLGIFTVQKIHWTGSLDYYTYDSRVKVAGQNSLGAELDAGLSFRYTGFVTFNLGMAYFFPGDLYGPTASKVTRYTAETHLHF